MLAQTHRPSIASTLPWILTLLAAAGCSPGYDGKSIAWWIDEATLKHSAAAQSVVQGQFGPTAIPRLLDRMQSRDEKVREEAVDLCFDIISAENAEIFTGGRWIPIKPSTSRFQGSAWSAATRAITGALRSRDAYVQRWAVGMVKDIGPRAHMAAPFLGELAHNGRPEIRPIAATALEAIGAQPDARSEEPARAEQQIFGECNAVNWEPTVIQTEVDGQRKYGVVPRWVTQQDDDPSGYASGSALIAALRSTDNIVTLLDDVEATPCLRSAVLYTVGLNGGIDGATANVVADALRDTSEAIAAFAAGAITACRAPVGKEVLRELIRVVDAMGSDETSVAAMSAIATVGDAKDPEVLRCLERASRAKSETVRGAAQVMILAAQRAGR